MALQGTLKDFGIADILQLIGQQQKTGTLQLSAKDQEVQIGFRDGSIVRAESTTRRKKDLIGNMLVRAELITDSQLEGALEIQRRTLKRLGDVLVSERILSEERFRQMMQLQATETLYGLFTWKNGTYAFHPGELDADPEAISPLRAESVLMEGFRMVDEWPVIKRTLGDHSLTFELLRALPLAAAAPAADADALGDFGEGAAPQRGELRTVGESERRVFALVRPGRDVRKLIDLSCLGEFETCKALSNLVSLGYLRARHPSGRLPAVGGSGAGRLHTAAGMLGRLALSCAVLAALALTGAHVYADGLGVARPPDRSFADPAAQRLVSQAQRARIAAALEVFRLEHGVLPEGLQALVDAGLLAEGDLRFPWRDPYHYRRLAGREYLLLPPLR